MHSLSLWHWDGRYCRRRGGVQCIIILLYDHFVSINGGVKQLGNWFNVNFHFFAVLILYNDGTVCWGIWNFTGQHKNVGMQQRANFSIWLLGPECRQIKKRDTLAVELLQGAIGGTHVVKCLPPVRKMRFEKSEVSHLVECYSEINLLSRIHISVGLCPHLVWIFLVHINLNIALNLCSIYMICLWCQ